MNKKYLIIGGIVLGVLVLGGILFLILGRKTTPTTPNNTNPQTNGGGTIDTSKETNLTIWGVFDDGSIFQPLIRDFNKKYPNIKITYAKKSYADYESTMVDAIASDQGPDIFNVSNFWLPKHKSKMTAAGNAILSADEFNQTFIQSAYDDFVADGKVYGVPLYTDNLVLYYNKKLLGKDSIYEAPKNWTDVLDYTKILTKKAPGNPRTITQGGIALGTSAITRSADILIALMMQTGTPIISDDKRSFNFNQFVKNVNGAPEYPGTNALNFYASFANPEKASYSWDDSLGDPITAFAQEKVAMIIGYSYFLPAIQKINPDLSYAIAPLPQIKGATENVNFVNYWGWSVSSRSKNQDAAWTFLKFIIDKDETAKYLEATGRTSPQKNNIGASPRVFDDQKYYSKTLFKGDAETFDSILSGMADDMLKFNQPAQSAIDTAARKANEMLTKFY